jgi:YfiH family protein
MAWSAEDEHRRVTALFTGREPAPRPPAVAWARQVHSDRCLRVAAAGEAGEGDALITDRPGLALAVYTADCVPVLLGAPGIVGAVHAGWRGLAAGIVGKALTAMTALGAAGVRAWIGPAIGPCCYEVGDDVAAAVVAASTPAIVRPGLRGRPHLDLVAAARAQLGRAGVGEVEAVAACTRCDAEHYWSYRRDGRGAGRNVSCIWLAAGSKLAAQET